MNYEAISPPLFLLHKRAKPAPPPSTCHHQVQLPRYSSKDVTAAQLARSVQEGLASTEDEDSFEAVQRRLMAQVRQQVETMRHSKRTLNVVREHILSSARASAGGDVQQGGRRTGDDRTSRCSCSFCVVFFKIRICVPSANSGLLITKPALIVAVTTGICMEAAKFRIHAIPWRPIFNIF